MFGRIFGRARRLARRFSVGPAAALAILSPSAVKASELGGSIHQSMGGLGGWGVGAAIVVALMIVFFAQPLRAQGTGGESWTDVKSLAQSLEGASAPMLIDVREPDEFVGPLGHIKGARNIPLNTLTSNPAQLASYKDKPLALICRTDRRASAAAFALRMSGFKNVTVVRGGMTQWNSDGLPVERQR